MQWGVAHCQKHARGAVSRGRPPGRGGRRADSQKMRSDKVERGAHSKAQAAAGYKGKSRIRASRDAEGFSGRVFRGHGREVIYTSLLRASSRVTSQCNANKRQTGAKRWRARPILLRIQLRLQGCATEDLAPRKPNRLPCPAG